MIDTTAVINNPCDETFVELARNLRNLLRTEPLGAYDKEGLAVIKSLPKDTRNQFMKYVVNVSKTVPYEQWPWV